VLLLTECAGEQDFGRAGGAIFDGQAAARPRVAGDFGDGGSEASANHEYISKI